MNSDSAAREVAFVEKALAALNRYEDARERQRLADVRVVIDFMDARWKLCEPAFLEHLENNGPGVPFREDLEIVPSSLAPVIERMIPEAHAPNFIFCSQTPLSSTQTLFVYLGTPEEEEPPDPPLKIDQYLYSYLRGMSPTASSSKATPAVKRVKILSPGEPRRLYLRTEIRAKSS